MSNQKTDFAINNNGFVVWKATGERVQDCERSAMSREQADDFGVHCAAALKGPVDVDRAYRPY